MTRLLLVLSALFALEACATGLCERKDRFFETTCGGTDVVYTADPQCEARIEGCSPAQKAAMSAYLECLEGANECSLAVVARCAEAHRGGVNLSCPLPSK